MLLIGDSNVDVIVQVGVDCGVGRGVRSIESVVLSACCCERLCVL